MLLVPPHKFHLNPDLVWELESVGMVSGWGVPLKTQSPIQLKMIIKQKLTLVTE